MPAPAGAIVANEAVVRRFELRRQIRSFVRQVRVTRKLPVSGLAQTNRRVGCSKRLFTR